MSKTTNKLPASEDVSAADVAFEFVATKVALLQFVEGFIGGDFQNEALDEWVYESPVMLPRDEENQDEWMAKLIERSNELGVAMLEVMGSCLLSEANRLRAYRAGKAA